jgi:allantoate deiminase
MEAAGLETRVDEAGNLRGVYGEGPALTIGAQLEGGILGVLIGIALAEQHPPYGVEIVAFASAARSGAHLEFRCEQGPVLECLGLPLGVAENIAGVSIWDLKFQGAADHAGATPMNMRHDGLACAAEWIGLVEHVAQTTAGLVATVGSLQAQPSQPDLIPGIVTASLDVRHAMDEVRERALNVMLDGAEHIAQRRGVQVTGEVRSNRAAVALEFETLERAVEAVAFPVRRLVDMVPTPEAPSSMLLLRGSGEPCEEDVDAALAVGAEYLRTQCPKLSFRGSAMGRE